MEAMATEMRESSAAISFRAASSLRKGRGRSAVSRVERTASMAHWRCCVRRLASMTAFQSAVRDSSSEMLVEREESLERRPWRSVSTREVTSERNCFLRATACSRRELRCFSSVTC